jgi:hypothetical protein
MLTVSAMMLSSATYAWFTMSREVEVNNIKMTATVPEDIQVSLGHLKNVVNKTSDVTVANANEHTGLANNEGVLDSADAAAADNGNVKKPLTGNDAISMLDWSNSADISEYYWLGKIIPASSTDGENIYFTPDASGVGKSLKTDAKYYTAVEKLTHKTEDRKVGTGEAATDATTFYRTTLHAITGTDDAWQTDATNGYKTAQEWNWTNDDGYYVDIPVWFRTSSTTGATLAVDAYVTTDAKVDEDDLYLAARTAIIYQDVDAPSDETIAAATAKTTGLIEVRKDKWSENVSIVDFMTSTNADGEAVKSVDGNHGATYNTDTHYNGKTAIKLNAGASNTYGTPTKAIIRVWLEGEDPNCWNQNAGQNFNISLKFSKEDVTPAVVPAGTDFATKKTSDAEKVTKDTVTTVTIGEGDNAPTLTYRYDGTNWKLLDGTFLYDATKEYSVQDGAAGNKVVNSDQIATQLKTAADTLTKAKAGVKVTVTNKQG